MLSTSRLLLLGVLAIAQVSVGEAGSHRHAGASAQQRPQVQAHKQAMKRHRVHGTQKRAEDGGSSGNQTVPGWDVRDGPAT